MREERACFLVSSTAAHLDACLHLWLPGDQRAEHLSHGGTREIHKLGTFSAIPGEIPIPISLLSSQKTEKVGIQMREHDAVPVCIYFLKEYTS